MTIKIKTRKVGERERRRRELNQQKRAIRPSAAQENLRKAPTMDSTLRTRPNSAVAPPPANTDTPFRADTQARQMGKPTTRNIITRRYLMAKKTTVHRLATTAVLRNV